MLDTGCYLCFGVRYVNVHGMISAVALNMVEGLKPIHRAALLRNFGSAEQVFRSSEMDLASLPEIKAELAHRIVHFDLRKAEAELKQAQQHAFHIICLQDADYPELLKTISDPPVVLYVHGSLRRDDVTVAVVGSRKPTPYGLNVAQLLATDLANAGVIVVSGLARGIDARAHKAVLQANARTIAVMGSGLDVIYPAEHRHLTRQIAEQGAVVSEFPLGTAPNRENFPIRNRVISGLSYAVVVVEASTKSGSLITARTATEQGREVLSVPGSIFNDSSSGCNALIKDGAALVQNWKDVIGVLPDHAARLVASDTSEKQASEVLTEVEKTVVSQLSFDQPQHVDQLATICGVASQDLLGVLVSLELKNYITQMPGKHFIRVK